MHCHRLQQSRRMENPYHPRTARQSPDPASKEAQRVAAFRSTDTTKINATVREGSAMQCDCTPPQQLSKRTFEEAFGHAEESSHTQIPEKCAETQARADAGDQEDSDGGCPLP